MCPPPETGSKPVRCPICGKPAAEAYRPFCSKRCADIDLAKWLGGAYAVPGRDEDEGGGGYPAPENDPSETDER